MGPTLKTMETTPSKPAVKAIPPKKANWLRRIITFLFLVFIGIQFIQPEKNNQSLDMRNDITGVVPVPDSVMNILKTSCYDCHSNYTEYPWYTNIQPGGWFLKSHIDDGKKHLNFQEFALVEPNAKYPTKVLRQDHKLDEIAEVVEDDFMPLDSYLWIHRDAKLDARQKKLIISWVDSAKKILVSPDKK